MKEYQFIIIFAIVGGFVGRYIGVQVWDLWYPASHRTIPLSTVPTILTHEYGIDAQVCSPPNND
jgi:hypothetical protein